jgi:hypothetical protein
MEILNNWLFWLYIVGAVALWKLIEWAIGSYGNYSSGRQVDRDRAAGRLIQIENRIKALKGCVGLSDWTEVIGCLGYTKTSSTFIPLTQRLTLLEKKVTDAIAGGEDNREIILKQFNQFAAKVTAVVIDQGAGLDKLLARVHALENPPNMPKTSGCTQTVTQPTPTKVTVKPQPAPKPAPRRTR